MSLPQSGRPHQAARQRVYMTPANVGMLLVFATHSAYDSHEKSGLDAGTFLGC